MDEVEAGTTPGRRARWRAASAALSARSDHDLLTLIEDGRTGHGIGGVHATFDVDGTTVFAKSVPVTELERRSSGSTADLVSLPAACRYGVGSPSTNVWREVAAHEQTTRWVLDGEDVTFPLLHHWRLLPGSTHEVPPEHADVEAAVAFFGGDRSVARRIEATAAAQWSVVLFLEHVPWNVEDWLGRELVAGDARADAAIDLLRRTLPGALARMNDRGLFHLDGHLRNILTDGEEVFVSDFGLATSTSFDLTDEERRFLAANRLYDPAYAVCRLVNQVVTALSGVVDPGAPDPRVRNDHIERIAEGGDVGDVPAGAAAFVARFAPLAVVMNDFSWQLFDGAPFTPFPTDRVEEAADACGLLARRDS